MFALWRRTADFQDRRRDSPNGACDTAGEIEKEKQPKNESNGAADHDEGIDRMALVLSAFVHVKQIASHGRDRRIEIGCDVRKFPAHQPMRHLPVRGA